MSIKICAAGLVTNKIVDEKSAWISGIWQDDEPQTQFYRLPTLEKSPCAVNFLVAMLNNYRFKNAQHDELILSFNVLKQNVDQSSNLLDVDNQKYSFEYGLYDEDFEFLQCFPCCFLPVKAWKFRSHSTLKTFAHRTPICQNDNLLILDKHASLPYSPNLALQNFHTHPEKKVWIAGAIDPTTKTTYLIDDSSVHSFQNNVHHETKLEKPCNTEVKIAAYKGIVALATQDNSITIYKNKKM